MRGVAARIVGAVTFITAGLAVPPMGTASALVLDTTGTWTLLIDPTNTSTGIANVKLT